MRRRVLYLIVAAALVLGIAFPMATSVLAGGISSGKLATQRSGDPVHPPGVYVMGQTVYYELRVENEGSTDELEVKIADEIPIDPTGWGEIPGVTKLYWWNAVTEEWVDTDPNTPVTILPDESWYGTFEYEIIEDGVRIHPSLDYPVWVNRFIASDDPEDEEALIRSTGTRTVRVIQPGIELQKDVTPDVAEVGQTVTYTFTITNTGDWPLENITIEDDKLDDAELQDEIPGDLVLAEDGEEGDSYTFTYEYTIQAGDLPLENTATVWGTAEDFDPAIEVAVVSHTDEAVVILDADPSIAIEKAVWDGEEWQDADTPPTGPSLPDTVDPVIFRFVITNTGNVDLTNVDLTDTDIATFYEDFDCTTEATFPIATLAEGATPVTVYGELDWAAGQHSNTADVEGTPPVGDPVTDDDMAHYFGVGPSIDLQKEVWDGEEWHDADAPTGPYLPDTVDPVIFRFVITNDGNVPLTDVTLSDTDIVEFYEDFSRNDPATFPMTLDPLDSETVYGSLDWAMGQHSNNATATGTPADEPIVSAGDDCHYFGSEASIDIQKAVWDGAEWHDADTETGPYLPDTVDPVVFRFTITNDGNVDLTNVMLNDTAMDQFYTDQGLTTAATFPIDTLAANVSATFYGSLDWAIGQHSNTATATGTPPVGDDEVDTDMAHYFGEGAYIDLQKAVWDGTAWHDADTPTGPYLSDSVDPVVFRFVITNTGTVTLNVTLTDDDFADFYTDFDRTILATFPISMLAGTSETFYGSLDWAAGQHTNTATAIGTPPDDPAVSAGDDCHYFGRTPPDITVGWDGQSVNKVAVLAPWIALMLGTVAGAVLFFRRRQATG